ncbi:hypothetical protein [Paracoccus shanxieyensis]|uniref:hypothetical protein n=1 Tax=Paracoccus shanxieyensis TaxID=2675752 RepID=UPI001E47D46A|nr:hypothetical protein [Paracoccus shanxieyensis]
MNQPHTATSVIIDRSKLPEGFPTHRHAAEFWEQLGRVIASFGFLEEVLGKAIFAFTATRRYSSAEIHAEYEAWLKKAWAGIDRSAVQPCGRLWEGRTRKSGYNNRKRF